MASSQGGSPPIRMVTASGRTWSLKKQAQMAASPPQIETVKQQVSAYEIDWPDLKDFLQKRFPKFPSELLVEDKSEDWYHLELPEELTTEDHIEIKRLKKSVKAQVQSVQRAVTPDSDK